jgi:Sulfotransferase domain
MWVLCCGMLRAGSTWQYLVASDLVERRLGGRRAGFAGLHLIREAYQKALDKKPRIIKMHDWDPAWSSLLSEDGARGLYAYRDLRDVTFSMMHKRAWSFERVIESGFLKRVIANDAFWRSQPNVLVQRYEAIIADYATAVREIALHLAVPVSAQECARIAASFSISRNRQRLEEFRDSLPASIDLNDPKNVQVRDTATQLHWNHIREGDPSWQELATPSQARLLEDACGDWLAANGYNVASET